MSIRFCELRQKEVISLCDGRRLGCICDAIIDKCGNIEAVIVPGQGGIIALFKNGKEIVIPWCKIVRLGDDVILVDVETPLLKKHNG